MSYATLQDVKDRMSKELSTEEEKICIALLEDCGIMIDAYNKKASDDVKRLVSCKMVIRAMSDTGSAVGIPVGASQGSMSALGYSQSWTMGSGSVGELYLSKAEKVLLGAGDQIGSYSPVQETG